MSWFTILKISEEEQLEDAKRYSTTEDLEDVSHYESIIREDVAPPILKVIKQKEQGRPNAKSWNLIIFDSSPLEHGGTMWDRESDVYHEKFYLLRKVVRKLGLERFLSLLSQAIGYKIGNPLGGNITLENSSITLGIINPKQTGEENE
jgi:hypothetical protein